MNSLAITPLPNTRRKNSAAILGIGTATPPGVTQVDAAVLAGELGCQTQQQREWLCRVFLRSGIESRGTVLATDPDTAMGSLRAFYPAPKTPDDHGPTTEQRMLRYAEEAPPLAAAAAIDALENASTPAAAITHLITVSCTGFFAPGLDAALIGRLGLSPSVGRIHMGFMGCHGAFNALAAARNAVLADPAAKVLVCCVELCSLHFAYGWDPGKLIANALFADGAAAMVIGRGRRRAGSGRNCWRLLDTASCLLPDSLDAMTWRIGNHGFEMTLASSVPELVGRHLRPWCESWLSRRGLEIGDIAHWAVHPGGPKVLTAVADALELPSEMMRHSREVLAGHGNMSSTTVLFILQHMARAGCSGPCVAIGLGPGLMAEGMLLEM